MLNNYPIRHLHRLRIYSSPNPDYILHEIHQSIVVIEDTPFLQTPHFFRKIIYLVGVLHLQAKYPKTVLSHPWQ